MSRGWGACEGQALALRAPRRVFFFGALRGTGPRATEAGVRFFRRAGPVPRDRFLILAILAILAILLQTIDIKVRKPLMSIASALLTLLAIDVIDVIYGWEDIANR